MNNLNYQEKYLKYKNKYDKLKKHNQVTGNFISGGAPSTDVKEILVHEDFIKTKKTLDLYDADAVYLEFVKDLHPKEVKHDGTQIFNLFGIENIKYYFIIEDEEYYGL